jgi:PIN domain nuclease of toxin-antitoxin system
MTRLLFDTNALLWYFWGNKRMRPVLEMIQTINAQVYVSAVSWWEIAIKIRSGKLPLNLPELLSFTKTYGIQELPLTAGHTTAYFNFPDLLHKDPFDHMLLAQAITEPMRFITGDAFLAEYSSLVMVV